MTAQRAQELINKVNWIPLWNTSSPDHARNSTTSPVITGKLIEFESCDCADRNCNRNKSTDRWLKFREMQSEEVFSEEHGRWDRRNKIGWKTWKGNASVRSRARILLSNRGGMHRMTVKREEPQESRATPINQRLTTGYADFSFSPLSARLSCARTRDHTHGVHSRAWKHRENVELLGN